MSVRQVAAYVNTLNCTVLIPFTNLHGLNVVGCSDGVLSYQVRLLIVLIFTNMFCHSTHEKL